MTSSSVTISDDDRKKINGLFNDHTCPICGKYFIGDSDWAYKLTSQTKAKGYQKKYYCSWHCLQAARA